MPADTSPRVARNAARRAVFLVKRVEKGVRGEGLSLIGICPF
jgi:hypothetical protein